MTIKLNLKRIAFVGFVLMLFSFMLATIFKFCKLSQIVQQPQRDVVIMMSIIFIAAVGCLLCLFAVVLSSINSVKDIIKECDSEMDENYYCDMSNLTEQEKDGVIKDFTELTAKHTLKLFMSLKLDSHIESMIKNEPTGEEFIFSFTKLKDGNFSSPLFANIEKSTNKVMSVGFANWLNANNFCYYAFQPNSWISPKRQTKNSNESIIYTTDQLFSEYELLIKNKII